MPAMATRTAPAFDVVADWERLPAGVSHRDVTGVAVDSQDRVYLFVRFPHRVLVYERDGSFVRSWGDDVFTMAHGLTIGPDDRVYCVDNGDHSSPLVLGSMRASCLSREQATRKARAKPLNSASILWWLERP